MRKTMAVPKLAVTMSGHCEKCGGEIEHKGDNWFQCKACGRHQLRKSSRVTPDHKAVETCKQRQEAGRLSHRAARKPHAKKQATA